MTDVFHQRWFGRFFLTVLVGILSIVQLAQAAGDDWRLEARLEKTQAYPLEKVQLVVTFLVGQVTVRNIQYPRLSPIGFQLGEFSPPSKNQQTRNGQDYIAHEFSATLRAPGPGPIRIGPVELGFDLIAPSGGSAAFFGGDVPRAITASAGPVSLDIRPLPERGRPAEFSGAIGRYSVDRSVAPETIQSGDAITVTTRIQGLEQGGRFVCPSLALPGTRSYPPRARPAKNSLVCEQVLRVDAGQNLPIPAASINYFDPTTGRYETARSKSMTLRVGSAPSGRRPENIPAPMAKPPESPASANWPWWGALIGLILAGGAVFASRRGRREDAKGNPVLQLREKLNAVEFALASNDPIGFYAAVFRCAQELAAIRLDSPAPALTASSLDPCPQHAALAALMSECDAVRYGGSSPDPWQMARTSEKLHELAFSQEKQA
jgi:hypothetical protein